FHGRRRTSGDRNDSQSETGSVGRPQRKRRYSRYCGQPDMARFPGEGTKSCLGFAAQKNPHKRVATIVTGFWKVLPFVMKDIVCCTRTSTLERSTISPE